MIDLTVLVPAYNEEATILGILERVGEQKIDGVNIEILVVDDGDGVEIVIQHDLAATAAGEVDVEFVAANRDRDEQPEQVDG